MSPIRHLYHCQSCFLLMPGTRASGKPFHGMPADLTLSTGNANSSFNHNHPRFLWAGFLWWILLFCCPLPACVIKVHRDLGDDSGRFKSSQPLRARASSLARQKASLSRTSFAYAGISLSTILSVPRVQSQIPHASRGQNEECEGKKYNSHLEHV